MAIKSNLEEMKGKKTGVEIISVHVPKTAGSAFTKVLLRVYGPEAVFLDYPYEKDYHRQFMKEGDAKVKVIHGHFPGAKYQNKFPDAKRIIWLREPVNFLISYYCFNKVFRRTVFYDLLQKKNLSFLEFAELPENQNLMSVYLRDMKLEDFYFVGIQDFFEEDLEELKTLLSWQDVEISRENNNLYADYKSLKKEVLSDRALVDKVAILNNKDVELYKQALNLRKKRRGETVEKAGKTPGLKEAIANKKSKPMKPSFLIIGGQKCGTTSLYQYLCEHPQVVSARRKEVSFFTGNFDKGNDWYLKQFPRVESQQIITGEASPNYIFYPHAPQRVFEFFPEMKLVALLRDPVERAISHYYHNRKMNQIIKGRKKREPLSLEMAIKREKGRIREDIKKLQIDNNYNNCSNYNHYSYLTKGIYIEQLKRWMEVFPREQLLILKSEELFKNSKTTLKAVLEFLDLPEFELQEYKQRNRGLLKSKNKKNISDSLKLQLAEFFQPHNQRLEEFLGMKFDWDNKYKNLEIEPATDGETKPD